jgi:hypothetical protein
MAKMKRGLFSLFPELATRLPTAARYDARMFTRLWLCFIASVLCARAAAPDAPFLQDRSEQFPAEGELAGATLKRVHVNKDGIVYVLTDRGMARLFDHKLALDRGFRPFNGKKILDTALARGEIFYLFDDALACNGFAGTYAVRLPTNRFNRIINITDELVATLTGKNGSVTIRDGQLIEVPKIEFAPIKLEGRVPFSDPSVSRDRGKDRWYGGPQGLFRKRANGAVDYYASRRWLLDDDVRDIAFDREGNVYALSKTGLNKIVFEPMTLEEKAAHYDDKIRQRHIRFGFCSELRLTRPGEPTSAEMIDTDNDGTWSNYYMASQAFRYGATHDPQAKSNAWETFATMERLEQINPLGGFPARTFERLGFRFSDPDRWHDKGDGWWEWKGTTSSDEIIAHGFGSSALYEAAATTSEEKARIAAFVSKIVDHILAHNLYLVDVDAKPTLWGRWNPEYVNWFPHSIFDRRLNSAEIVGLLEFAYTLTGRETYKAKGMELLEKHGYLENIMSSMTNIAFTKGFVHQGIELGTDWNHSDDLLGFDAYWVLHRYAFNAELKKKFAGAMRDHWQLERSEWNPLWNFVYASTKPAHIDLDEALWTLRRFPWDTVDWSVHNSHRLDVTKLPENFRQQELKELLPPGERRITRWNGGPFTLDGGSGGLTELAGDEYLLPYWMGRYLKIISDAKPARGGPIVSP